MGKIANEVNKINFTMLYGNYFFSIIENFPKNFSPCSVIPARVIGRILTGDHLLPVARGLDKNQDLREA